VPSTLKHGAAKKCLSPLGRGGAPEYDDGGRLLHESARNGIVSHSGACKSDNTGNVGKGDRPTIFHQVVPKGRIDGASSIKAASVQVSSWSPNPGAATFTPATNCPNDDVFPLDCCAAHRQSEVDALVRRIADHGEIVRANQNDCAAATAAVAHARAHPATRGADVAQRRTAHRVRLATLERNEHVCHQRLLKSRTEGQDLAWHLDEARAAAAAATALALEATVEAYAPRVSWNDTVSFAALPARCNTESSVQLQSPALTYVAASTTYGDDMAGVTLPKRSTPLSDRALHRHRVDSIVTPVEPVRPVEPAAPVQPAKSAMPAQPAKSATPAEPAMSEMLAEQAKSATPAEQAKSATPVQSAKRAMPVQPGQSATPEQPAKSANSATTGEPAVPIPAATSVQPGTPAATVDLAKSEELAGPGVQPSNKPAGNGNRAKRRRRAAQRAAARALARNDTGARAGAVREWRYHGKGDDRNTGYSRTIRAMVDTGATKPIFAARPGEPLTTSGHEVINVTDAQGATFSAFGGNALWARLQSRLGPITKMIATSAFASTSMPESLMSYPALRQAGWHLIDASGAVPFLRHRDGDEVELEVDRDDHFWLTFDIVPPTAAAPRFSDGWEDGPFGDDPPSVAYPVRMGGAQLPLRWSTNLGNIDNAHYADVPLPTGMGPPTASGDTTAAAPAVETAELAAPAATLPEPDETTEQATSAATASAVDSHQQQYANYYRAHESCNHSCSAVDDLIKHGLLTDAVKPPNFKCIPCAMSDNSGAHFSRRTKTEHRDPGTPYNNWVVDLWGPYDCGDRNGFRYLLGAIDKATGKVFLQPIRKKSDATGAMQAIKVTIDSECSGIQAHLRHHIKDIHITGIKVITSDRGGEFTTTFGCTETAFDEFIRENNIRHCLTTPHTPESGTTPIERLWSTLSRAARSHLLTSGLGQQYYFDAMIYAADVYNCMPTKSNKFGRGEAPNATLGLDYDIRVFVPFGTLGYMHVHGNKQDAKNVLVVIIGLDHDGHGYRAIRVTDGTVVTSINIKVQSHAGTAQSLIAEPATASNAAVVSFVAEHCCQDGSMLLLPATATSGQLASLHDSTDDKVTATSTPLLVQQVGNAPGHGGSRVSLRPRAQLTAGSRHGDPKSRPPTWAQKTDDVTARAMVRDARKAGLILYWCPGHVKKGVSGERYQFYSKAKTFAQFDALTKERFLSGITGTMKPRAVSTDLAFDVARGILKFVDADTPPVQPADQDTHTDAPEGSDDDSTDDSGRPTPENEPPPGHGRYLLRRRRTVRAAIANVKKTLTPDERNLLRAGLGVKAASAYIGVPDVFMMAAKIRHDRVQIPKSIWEARKTPQWPQWLAALKKEYGGLRDHGVFDEVERSSVPLGTKVVPTQLLFNIKADGTFKVRIVVRGDLTTAGEHYLETKSSMVSLDTVRMIVALAAGSDMILLSTDFSQAFLNAMLDDPKLYCALPELPLEMRGGDFGVGGKTRAAHVHKAWYGLPQAPRCWQQHLMRYLLDPEKIGANLYIHDRNAFEWEWNGHRLIGCIHVDDVLFAVSSLDIRDEFMRRLRAEFLVTGGDEEATTFCGLEIERNWDDHTVTLTQKSFARKLMDKYDMWDFQPELTPARVGASKLVPATEKQSEEDTFDYAMCLGDLAWYSRTNPGLSFVVHDLARFMQNPGTEHVEAAYRVLRYILGHLDAGLTYHGSTEVLTKPYDHLNKLIATFDADFPHDGVKATSGAAVLLNGAAISWKTRRQTTVSLTSTEAEVKAMVPGVEMIKSLTGLWAEFMHQPHGCVRVLDDSKPAISQIQHGMDSRKVASYKLAHFYVEDALDSGLIWLDFIPGAHNPSDVLTKNTANIAEFDRKVGILNGSAPHLYESSTVRKILEDAKR